MEPFEIGFAFDASPGAGLGHYARCQAIARATGEHSPPILAKHFGILSDGNPCAHPVLKDEPIQFLSSSSLARECENLDALFLDSYDPSIQSLTWLKTERLSSLSLIADSTWACCLENVHNILDATYSWEADMAPGCRHWAGPEAVFLALENVPETTVLPPVVTLGGSDLARHTLRTMIENKRFFDDLLGQDWLHTSPSPKFGHVTLEDAGETIVEPSIALSRAIQNASELVTAAGQTLWEACARRKRFWILALTPLHEEVVNRLLDNRVLLSIHPISESPVGPLVEVEVPAETKETITACQIRACALAKRIIGS